MNEHYDLIQTVQLTEKASLLSEKLNKYVFRVSPRANKIQIKQAIEELYAKEKVTVVSVNVLTTKAKEKRRGTKRGRILGFTTPWRKAIVTLAPGQKIDFFEGV
jgi:large subunit ribosomal protein L23